MLLRQGLASLHAGVPLQPEKQSLAPVQKQRRHWARADSAKCCHAVKEGFQDQVAAVMVEQVLPAWRVQLVA